MCGADIISVNQCSEMKAFVQLTPYHGMKLETALNLMPVSS